MAKPPKTQPVIVTCETCKKQILPDPGHPIPTSYVVFNGHNLCWDCIKSGKSKPFSQL